MDKFKGILFAALSAATFGLIPLYANQAILDGVNNETILVYRYGIAGIVYAIYLLFRRMNMRLTRREVKEVTLAGVGGYGITAFFLMWSYHYMPTGVATAIHFFYPVVVALLMAIFYKERLPLEVKAGIVLAICGVYLLSWTPGEVKWLGLFFVLMSTVTYGCYITRVKADESGRADLLRVTIHRAVLLDLGRGTGEDGNHHETPVLAGYGAVGHIEYDRFCPVAGGSREIDRFRTEFRVGNVGTDNGNRRGSTLFQ